MNGLGILRTSESFFYSKKNNENPKCSIQKIIFILLHLKKKIQNINTALNKIFENTNGPAINI